MKRAIGILPALAAIAIASVLIAAEDKEPKPEMALVIVEQVKPAMRKQYEAATKEMCALLTEHGADPSVVGFWVVSGPEMGYAFIIPLADGFSSMKTTRENWMGTIESIGKERWKAISAKADACVESRSMTHSVYREDLSYVPENPSLKEEDIKFAQYDFLYPHANAEEAFAEMAKEWQALYARHGIRTGWRVYERITGEDLPEFMVVKVAKSEAEYYTTRDAIRDELGDEVEPLGEKFSQLIRKMESMPGYPRPDLSYPTQPKE